MGKIYGDFGKVDHTLYYEKYTSCTVCLSVIPFFPVLESTVMYWTIIIIKI